MELSFSRMFAARHVCFASAESRKFHVLFSMSFSSVHGNLFQQFCALRVRAKVTRSLHRSIDMLVLNVHDVGWSSG